MNSEPTVRNQHCDVLVVGAGPAGLSAAAGAAECGVTTNVVDDNPVPGGQIWRAESSAVSPEANHRIQRLQAMRVRVFWGTRVVHEVEPGKLLAETDRELLELSYKKLILATGARELFLPFPGWTLPNVMGAGGLQALVKSGLPIAGKRVLVAGSGPLLLAVAAYLSKHGAEIPMICEQASMSSLARFGLSLLRQPKKLRQGLSLRKDMDGIPYAADCWPVEAHGSRSLEEVVISRGSKSSSETIPCDYLACGFHLVPNTELPELLGCKLRDSFVHVDDLQQTSVPGTFCAGEPTGIGGLELALVEGEIAGLAAGGRAESAKRLFKERRNLRRFAHTLDRTFAVRSDLRGLPRPETMVCRCEDVSYSRVAEHQSWRAAKLQTRCGMGPCQGRVCGPITRFLFGWSPDAVRPPISPTRFESLAAMACQVQPEHSQVTGERT